MLYAPGTIILPSLPQAAKRNPSGNLVSPAQVKTRAGEGGLGTTRNCLESVIEHFPRLLWIVKVRMKEVSILLIEKTSVAGWQC